MLRPYDTANAIIPELEKWVRANIDTCTDMMFPDNDDDHAEFLAGQLQAWNMMYNLLTTIYAVPQPAPEDNDL